MPKDIDLDNGELDEFEKELEAFKRFVNILHIFKNTFYLLNLLLISYD